MKMPYGKDKGEEITSLSYGYLKWLVDNCEDDEIRECAENEIAERKDKAPRF